MICDYLKSSQTSSTSSLLQLYRQVTHDSSFFTRRLHTALGRLYRLSAPQCHLRSHFRHAKEAAKNTELSVKLISASQAAFAFASHRRQYLALIYFYLSALIISTSYTSPHRTITITITITTSTHTQSTRKSLRILPVSSTRLPLRLLYKAHFSPPEQG